MSLIAACPYRAGAGGGVGDVSLIAACPPRAGAGGGQGDNAACLRAGAGGGEGDMSQLVLQDRVDPRAPAAALRRGGHLELLPLPVCDRGGRGAPATHGDGSRGRGPPRGHVRGDSI